VSSIRPGLSHLGRGGLKDWLLVVFSIWPCLAARLSRWVGVVSRALGFSFLWRRAVPSGQPGGRAWRLVTAAVTSAAQAQRSASRKCRRRPLLAAARVAQYDGHSVACACGRCTRRRLRTPGMPAP